MTQPAGEIEELRISIERLRGLLEGLVVRGLRACGEDELAQLRSYIEQLERAGAGHVAAALARLEGHIRGGDRAAAVDLLTAQTAVRLLERLLTLRVANSHFQAAAAVAAAMKGNAAGNDSPDAEEEGDA